MVPWKQGKGSVCTPVRREEKQEIVGVLGMAEFQHAALGSREANMFLWNPGAGIGTHSIVRPLLRPAHIGKTVA